jgi:uncharacterized ubiquitin-like protein YukD
MSETVSIKILDATGTKKQDVEVPNNAQAARLVAKLIEVLELPIAGPDGQPMVYKLHHRASGRQLRDEDTLDKVGVSAGDELRMIPEIIAG